MNTMKYIKGAYSLLVMSSQKLIAVQVTHKDLDHFVWGN